MGTRDVVQLRHNPGYAIKQCPMMMMYKIFVEPCVCELISRIDSYVNYFVLLVVLEYLLLQVYRPTSSSRKPELVDAITSMSAGGMSLVDS